MGKNKTKKVTSATDFMAFRVLSNFLASFSNFFSISRNYTKFYLHAKIQINWTIQTEITAIPI